MGKAWSAVHKILTLKNEGLKAVPETKLGTGPKGFAKNVEGPRPKAFFAKPSGPVTAESLVFMPENPKFEGQ